MPIQAGVNVNLNITVKVKQSLYRPNTGPEGPRRFRLPDCKAIGT
jgi:hypothetical protein